MAVGAGLAARGFDDFDDADGVRRFRAAFRQRTT